MYLEPKAMELIYWNGSKTRGEAEKEGHPGLKIADHLFSVLIQLQCSLISEATYIQQIIYFIDNLFIQRNLTVVSFSIKRTGVAVDATIF